MRKKDPTRTWRKTMRRLFTAGKVKKPIEDVTEEIEKSILANGPDRRMVD